MTTDCIGGARRLKVLFFLRAANFDRLFECFLEELLRRGHLVEVAFEKEKGLKTVHVYDGLRERYPQQLAYEQLKRRRDRFAALAARMRRGIDYLRYLEPEYEDAHALRKRVASRTSRLLRMMASVRSARHVLNRVLRSIDSSIPVPRPIEAFISRHAPDVVLVSPLVEVGSLQGDYIRAARSLGIPTVVPVASWDNLTNKGLIRDYPDRVIVWNEAQIDEATRLHGLPRESIVAVGAHTYDHWFAWQRTADRSTFLRSVGLDVETAYILYVCSSGFIAPNEVGFVSEWITQLRGSADPLLRDIGVLIRPHPQNFSQWDAFDVTEWEGVVVYPKGGAAPTDAKKKAEYYNSLHHCSAVVGINTSAMIEAAIVKKPVFTISTDAFRQTQDGTLHFAHLTGDDGVLSIARGWEDHLAQLHEAVADPEREADRVTRFVARFVRPYGLDRAGAPLAVDVVEEAARLHLEPAPRPSGAGRAVIEVWAWLSYGRDELLRPLYARIILLARVARTDPAAVRPLVARFLRRQMLAPIRRALIFAIRLVLVGLRRLPRRVQMRLVSASWTLVRSLPDPVQGRLERTLLAADPALQSVHREPPRTPPTARSGEPR
jgi:hypothetical protein